MSDTRTGPQASETSVMVRYWAGARAAAGLSSEDVDTAEAGTLADLLTTLADRRAPESAASHFAKVLDSCSVLVGEQPVSSSDPADVALAPGDVVEFLPPFAGG